MKLVKSLICAAVLAGLLPGCASYSDTRPDNFARLWQPESGVWQLSEHGGLHGACPQEDPECKQHWASINGRLALPANYHISTRVTLEQGVLAELMLERTRQQYIRVYLYLIDQKLALGKGQSSTEQPYGGATLARVPFKVELGRSYQLDIVSCNRNLSISIDGKRYLSGIPKMPQHKGTLGFALNGAGRFDALKVETLDRFACPTDARFAYPEGLPQPPIWFLFSE